MIRDAGRRNGGIDAACSVDCDSLASRIGHHQKEGALAKLDDEKIQAAFQSYLNPGEELRNWAFGVKQPNILLILALLLLAILPGIIAIFLLTKKYLIGLTDSRLIVLRIKMNAEVKEMTEYGLAAIRGMDVKTSTGGIFTHIKIRDAEKPFVAKFHRAFSKNNRPHAMAIAEAISGSAPSE